MVYWNKRKDPNSDAGKDVARVKFDANYIRQNLTKGDSVLELGPGTGRTFSSYDAGMHVTTLDISKLYQDKLAGVADSAGLILDQHFLEDTKEAFPFSDQEFDAGVSFQVYIHQPPDVFEHHFSEMGRVCKRIIVCVGVHANTTGSEIHSAPHVFCHDYILEAAKNGKIITNLLVSNSVMYFVLEGDPDNLWMQGRG